MHRDKNLYRMALERAIGNDTDFAREDIKSARDALERSVICMCIEHTYNAFEHLIDASYKLSRLEKIDAEKR